MDNPFRYPSRAGVQAAEVEISSEAPEVVRGEKATADIWKTVESFPPPPNPYERLPVFLVQSFVLAAGATATFETNTRDVEWFHVYAATNGATPVFGVSLGASVDAAREMLITTAGGLHSLTIPARDTAVTIRNAGGGTETFTILAYSRHYCGVGAHG